MNKLIRVGKYALLELSSDESGYDFYSGSVEYACASLKSGAESVQVEFASCGKFQLDFSNTEVAGVTYANNTLLFNAVLALLSA